MFHGRVSLDLLSRCSRYALDRGTIAFGNRIARTDRLTNW